MMITVSRIYANVFGQTNGKIANANTETERFDLPNQDTEMLDQTVSSPLDEIAA